MIWLTFSAPPNSEEARFALNPDHLIYAAREGAQTRLCLVNGFGFLYVVEMPKEIVRLIEAGKS